LILKAKTSKKLILSEAFYPHSHMGVSSYINGVFNTLIQKKSLGLTKAFELLT
jgi:hypothetical protein